MNSRVASGSSVIVSCAVCVSVCVLVLVLVARCLVWNFPGCPAVSVSCPAVSVVVAAVLRCCCYLYSTDGYFTDGYSTDGYSTDGYCDVSHWLLHLTTPADTYAATPTPTTTTITTPYYYHHYSQY